MEVLDAFAASMLTLDRWPFWAAAIIFTVIGQFTSLKLFTRERAYTKGRFQLLWWWGRETLMLHPITAGFVLGTVWSDPEGAGWPTIANQMYFATAGAVSLGAWAWLRGHLKQRGVAIQLPGTSEPPKT